jgi:hypothetical protein
LTCAFSVSVEIETGLKIRHFDAFSSREPVSTSLENALFHRDRFGEIPRLVDVGAHHHGGVIGQ